MGSQDTDTHMGHGTAGYVERSSAIEATRFSPLLGFIEVQLLDDATASASSNGTKRQRRNRFDEDVGEDLGPFEAALSQRQQAQRPIASSAEVMDLGPFEAVLPRKDIEDLGPFEAVLRPKEDASEAADDLGPFEAVLPPSRSNKSTADDLGPF